MNKKILSKILMLSISEMLLAVLLFVILLFGSSYVQTNFYAFTDFSILKYGNGIDGFWMALYLSSNAIFILTVSLILLELVLFTIRMMGKVAFSTIEALTHKESHKLKTFFQNFSIIYLFKKIKINNKKKALIAYLVLIVLIFGVKFVAKQVLASSDADLYRVYENINLYSDKYNNFMTDEISNNEEYSIEINTSVGNVHIYTLSERTDIEMIYLYDSLLQKCTLSYVIDTENKVIQISFNEDVTNYTMYEDDLMPQIELYLPATLLIDSITVNIENQGTLSMQYVNANSLDVDANNALINIKLTDYTIDNYNFNLTNTDIRVETDSLKNFTIALDHSYSILLLTDVENSINISATNYSSVYLYQTISYKLTSYTSRSTIDFREMYAQIIDITTIHDDFQFINGNANNQPAVATITSFESTIEVKGVTYDSESLPS